MFLLLIIFYSEFKLILKDFKSCFVKTRRCKIRTNEETNHWYFRMSSPLVNNHFVDTHNKVKIYIYISNLREKNLTNQFIVGKGNNFDVITKLQAS